MNHLVKQFIMTIKTSVKNSIIDLNIFLKNNLLKNLILRYIFSLFIPFILTGCYESFTPDIETEPVLCLNCLITAGEPIKVDVTHTWLYTDMAGAENHSVKDAVIRVIVNDEEKDSEYLPKDGDRIRIEADSPTYGHAEAEVTVPHAVPIQNVRWTPVITSTWRDDRDGYWAVNAQYYFNINIEMEINDPDVKENYYRFSALSFNSTPSEPDIDDTGIITENYDEDDAFLSSGYWKSDFYMGSMEYDAEPLFSEHIGVFESVMIGDAYGFTFFTDRQFSGSKYPLHLNYTDASYFITMKEWDPELMDCGYLLTLHSISKSYYDWANYNWQKEDGPLGDMGDLGLAEPMWAYSNVSTGAGVVAAQSYTTYTLNLREFFESIIKD